MVYLFADSAFVHNARKGRKHVQTILPYRRICGLQWEYWFKYVGVETFLDPIYFDCGIQDQHYNAHDDPQEDSLGQ